MCFSFAYYSSTDNFFHYAVLEFFIRCGQEIQDFAANEQDLIAVRKSVQKINSTMMSSDVTLRIITLRIFTCIPRVLSSEPLVHYSVITSLSSQSEAEAKSSLDAAEALARHSAAFAALSCDVIAQHALSETNSIALRVCALRALRSHTHTHEMIETVWTKRGCACSAICGFMK